MPPSRNAKYSEKTLSRVQFCTRFFENAFTRSHLSCNAARPVRGGLNEEA
ncbi:hypothetical protein BN137_4291 [Cronobacter condimenti 1330]|uniref:Uncharacterized protein n=1 Tax=Cronobacter condimenti 1330 TaxID=1073999 RepID=K8A4Y5_9ENTR|nr:hypothetical protein BN137_4291 [Cronobacter condimenti 1330]